MQNQIKKEISIKQTGESNFILPKKWQPIFFYDAALHILCIQCVSQFWLHENNTRSMVARANTSIVRIKNEKKRNIKNKTYDYTECFIAKCPDDKRRP